MQPRITTLSEKKLVGHRLAMSLTHNKTGELWRGFAPKIKDIQYRVSADKISMQVYPASYHALFDPNQFFEKWAAVEVADFNHIPASMETFVLQGGLYAVFDYKGASSDNSIFQYIFMTWLPSSAYQLDDRPHFEVLGEKYQNNDPNSEEEIWIPIKERAAGR
jgi:AraC family transcriptional regulator